MPVYSMDGSASPAAPLAGLESAGTSVEFDEGETTLMVTESAGVEVLEIHDGEPDTLLITEPVSVDPASIGMRADDLVDLDGFTDAPTEAVMVLFKGADGVLRPIRSDLVAHTHWGEEIRFGDGEPVVTAPHGATWVDYVSGTIYEAGETA